jgi:hypothetical protein
VELKPTGLSTQTYARFSFDHVLKPQEVLTSAAPSVENGIAQMPPRTKTNRKLHVAAKKAPMATSFEPMLPTLVNKPFSEPGWLFEPK